VKTVMWLYLFIFVAFFDLHAQYPMLTPFAISLGAAPSFIGLIMGIYSLTHLPGNLLAGYSVDRYGSKPFIVASLVAAGALLIVQGHVRDPWQLLAVRSASGFVLAFLSPACLALLAKMARDRVHQSKLMAGNGLVHTLASVVSPAVGALLVAKVGFTSSFVALGWGLVVTGVLAIFGVKEAKSASSAKFMNPSKSANVAKFTDSATFAKPAMSAYSAKSGKSANPAKSATAEQDANDGFPGAASQPPDDAYAHSTSGSTDGKDSLPWLFYGVPLALSCSQGILFFELPLLAESQTSVMESGLLFSLVSVGALVTLAMVFLNHVSPHVRTIAGSFALSLVFFGMAVRWSVPLPMALLMVGMAKGVIFPALAALLASITDAGKYGRVFSVLSISFSIGAFLGPIVAGYTRDYISPYFIAFAALMGAVALLPPPFGKKTPASVR